MAPPQRRRTPMEVSAMVVVGIFFFLITISLIPQAPRDFETNFCPQVKSIDPRVLAPHLAKSTLFLEHDYAHKSSKLLQGAVRIPTEVYDEMVDVNDERFLPFLEFQTYLKKMFPLAAKHMEIINKYGILYTFKGEGSGTLLMSHQDTMPAGDASNWHHPPFDGHFDGEYMHGRGVCDAKSNLIGILEAVEALLEQKWSPISPLVIAFGFDKENGGALGAETLSNVVHERFGHESFKVVLDEGLGVEKRYGSMVALPGISEKGNINVELELKVPGGHSSAPPDHSGIGIMAQMIRKIERNAHNTLIPDDNPILQTYRCMAEHSEHMPKSDRRAILNPRHRKEGVRVIKADTQFHEYLRTTQSVNIISGGVKINALPETVNAIIDHHVSVDSSTAAVIDRIEHFAMQTAEKFDLKVWSQDELLREGSYGMINITVSNRVEPSPVSPYSGPIWDTLSGTTRHVFGDISASPGDLIVAPSIAASSTDTNLFWHLTRSIYRFSPGFQADQVNRHAANERLLFRSHLISVAWYYEFIINMTS